MRAFRCSLWTIITLATALAGAVGGCSNKLETGYEPRKLGASEAERRGFYAAPFTPEARAAQLQRDEEFDARRPRPGY
jgi:hypothetical protein